MNLVRGVVAAVFLFVVTACQTCGNKPIKPFTSDGCTGFPDGTRTHRDLWLKCCTAHDLKYWAGGSYEQRLQADQDLLICVESTGEPEIAGLMLAGTRVGGSPWWPSRFRWGYGWDYAHGYTELTPEELEQVSLQKERQGLN